MKKYQCNSCGKIHDDEWEAIRCHPDINVIDEDALPDRAAEHRDGAVTEHSGTCCEANSADMFGKPLGYCGECGEPVPS